VDTKIVFNGKQFENITALKDEIKKLSLEDLTFSGSLTYNNGLIMDVFGIVKYESAEYYINKFNTLSKQQEVTLEFQTDDAITKRIQ
jgi:hypothetical protein